MLWALLTWGNKHFPPEGASVVLVDAASGELADPVLVDRRSGRPLAEPAFRTAPGPAADERTRKRHGIARTGSDVVLRSAEPEDSAGA